MGLEAKRRTVHDPRTTKHAENEKRLNFQVNLLFWRESGTRCSGHAVMGLEAKRRTVHDPRYHKTPNNEKRLTFSSKPFILERKRDTLFGTRCHGARSETSHRPRPSVPQDS